MENSAGETWVSAAKIPYHLSVKSESTGLKLSQTNRHPGRAFVSVRENHRFSVGESVSVRGVRRGGQWDPLGTLI